MMSSLVDALKQSNMQEQAEIDSGSQLMGFNQVSDAKSSSGDQQQSSVGQENNQLSSFDQLANSDDFHSQPNPSTTPTNDNRNQPQNFDQFATTNNPSDLAPTSGDAELDSGRANSRQSQMQFSTATGAPISTPSSLSMSLDGMIVNSRPRASSNAIPQPRMGKLTSNNNEQSSEFSSNPKASRRVPLAGTPISSPATKGMRSKSSVGPTSRQNLQQSAPKSAFQSEILASTPQSNQRSQSADFAMQQLEGFDDDNNNKDRRFNQQPAGFQSALDATGLELMKNLLASRAQLDSSNQKPSMGATSGDDMVMSVMSSADGKERRLVMIARDTLENLQRFAAQQQRQSPSSTQIKGRSKVQQPQQANDWAGNKQVSVSTASSANAMNSNWWPSQSKANNNNQQPESTTLSPPKGRNAQVEVQTTTATPTTASEMLISQTTTTTQPPTTVAQLNSAQTLSSFSQESQPSSTSSENLSTSNAESNATTPTLASNSDSFREVPVSTLVESEAPKAKSSQQVAIGDGRSAKSGKSVGKSAKQQQADATQRQSQSNKSQPSKTNNSKSASGKKKTNSESPKAKQVETSKPATAKSTSKTGKSKSNVQVSVKRTQPKKQSRVSTSNNQQQPAAAPVEQQQPTESSATRNATSQDSTPAGSFTAEAQSAKVAKGTRLESSAEQEQQVSSNAGDESSQRRSSLNQIKPASSSSSDKRQDSQAGRARQQDFEQSFSADNHLEALRASIPGEPQLDYPTFSSPPKTSFDCMSQSCPGGYYADLETQCQVFHICQNDGRFDSFLCPNGTIFSQQHFVCVWWWQVDCQQSASFYNLNDGIYCNPSVYFNQPDRQSVSVSSSNSTRPADGVDSSRASQGSSNQNAQVEDQNGGSDREPKTENQNQRQSTSDSEQQQQQQQQLELLSRKA